MKTKVIAALASLSATAAVPPEHVDMKRMSDVTRVLASDEFQGRSMGTAGEQRTIPYLIEQFKAAGLQPAGENGGWTQDVPMIRTKLQSPMSFSIRQGSSTVPLQFPDDIYLSTVRPVDRARIADAPLVFVGYGVTAPERGWDDFKGVDLTGKVAIFLVNDPDFEAAAGEAVAGKFGGPTMTYYGRWTYKFEEAARRGAIGALIVHETNAAGYGWNVVQSPAGENFNIVLPAGAQQPILLQGWVQQPVA
ncbi:MAG: peptidase M20, partial [Sphingomicrobium sp.]